MVCLRPNDILDGRQVMFAQFGSPRLLRVRKIHVIHAALKSHAKTHAKTQALGSATLYPRSHYF